MPRVKTEMGLPTVLTVIVARWRRAIPEKVGGAPTLCFRECPGEIFSFSACSAPLSGGMSVAPTYHRKKYRCTDRCDEGWCQIFGEHLRKLLVR